jgi:DNA-binding MarR family transcriptional regulator
LSDTPGLNQGQVAKVLQYSANRLVADLDDLQQRGLTIRQPGDDRRSNHLFATKAGMDLKERVQHEVHAREDELLAPLTVNRQRVLRAALQDLARQLRLGRLSDGQ